MAGVLVIMPGSPGPRVVTVNELLDGQVVLDIECLDRIYLSGFVNSLQAVPLENRIRLVACRSSVRQAACMYSLIRPLTTGFRWIRAVSGSVMVTWRTCWWSSGTCWPMPW